MTLPDSTRVYPAHGAGSACGKNLSTETSSTIGDQRTQNYALAPMDRDDFIAVVTEGQTAPPAYFAYDAVLNRENRPIFDETVSPNALTLAEVVRAQRQGAIVLDTRDPNEFSAGHLIGSINVGLAGRYAEFAGGVIQPGVAIVLVADEGEELESKIRLARIGFDNVIGHLDNPLVVFNANLDDVARSSRVDVATMQAAMDRLDGVQVVDVRQLGETTSGVIPGAQLIPLTTLNKQLASLDASKPTIVYCAGGYRSSIAASRLAAAGFHDVSDLLGGFGAWEGAGAPVDGRDGSELAATN